MDQGRRNALAEFEVTEEDLAKPANRKVGAILTGGSARRRVKRGPRKGVKKPKRRPRVTRPSVGKGVSRRRGGGRRSRVVKRRKKQVRGKGGRRRKVGGKRRK